jgi:hypothetical protein
MLRIVAVGVGPKTMAKWSFGADLILRHTFDEMNKASMSVFHLAQDFRKGKIFLVLRGEGIKGIDAAIGASRVAVYPQIQN